MKLFTLILAVLCITVSAQGLMFHLDGYANAYPVLADQTLIVLSTRISGTSGCELLAIDSPSGKVLWRDKSSQFINQAFSDNLQELYAVEGQALVSRSRLNGAMLWKMDLAILPWTEQHKYTNSSREAFTFDFYKPDRYIFVIAAFSSQGFLITRTGERGSGCCVSIGPEHWALLDRKYRHILAAGSGRFVTANKDDMLIACPSSERKLQHVTAASERDITSLLSQTINDWYIPPQRYQRSGTHSSRYCTFGVYDQQKDGTNSVFIHQQAVYDTKRQALRTLHPISERSYQLNWANTDQWLLRYSECESPTASQSQDTQLSAPLWLEAYEITGKLKGRLTFTTEPIAGSKSQRFLFQVGVTQKGYFVFIDQTYIYATNTPRGTLHHVRALMIDGNGPKLVRSIDIGAEKQMATSVQLLADQDALVQVLGDVDLPKMKAPTERHTLTTRLVSLKEGRELWRHDENVVIRKAD